MSEEMKLIAERIRELREIFGLTEEQMAEEVNVTPGEYREYEASGKNIPISVLYHIAQKFEVDMTEILTGKPARLHTYAICRRGKGKTIERFPGYHFESLAHRFSGKTLEPLLVTMLPSDEKPSLVTHAGQEFNLILEGTIVLSYDQEQLTLQEGDAIYFDPTHPHGQHAVGEGKARFLTIITE